MTAIEFYNKNISIETLSDDFADLLNNATFRYLKSINPQGVYNPSFNIEDYTFDTVVTYLDIDGERVYSFIYDTRLHDVNACALQVDTMSVKIGVEIKEKELEAILDTNTFSTSVNDNESMIMELSNIIKSYQDVIDAMKEDINGAIDRNWDIGLRECVKDWMNESVFDMGLINEISNRNSFTKLKERYNKLKK